MRLYNTLTRSTELFTPLKDKNARIYSCGPTVYDHAHIGNLSSYIFADTLNRVLQASGYGVTHAMNYTDVDDKTIRRSQERFAGENPHSALRKLTDEYIAIFLRDMQSVGNRTDKLTFMRATDYIGHMQQLITELRADNFAYIADDGVYFSIEGYKNAGYTYGQLLDIDANNTSSARIQNDEYDKAEVHDFALWKKQKPGEPAWEFTLDGQNLVGRPGWHIECSAMSRAGLGQPFDIHTGGIDLIFPHHENEIAQSTAGLLHPEMAQFFCHNEHILVDGKKMAKSAGNFYTLDDITAKGFEPLAFRLLVLQAHYRNQVNFTFDSLTAAQNRLKDLRAVAALAWQANDAAQGGVEFIELSRAVLEALQDDLNTPEALALFSELTDEIKEKGITKQEESAFRSLLQFLDLLFGLELDKVQDISPEQKALIAERENARKDHEWERADELRAKLTVQGIALRDTDYGSVWYRT